MSSLHLSPARGYADVLRVGSRMLAICSKASEAWRAKQCALRSRAHLPLTQSRRSLPLNGSGGTMSTYPN